MITKDKILEVLKKIIQNKTYNGDTYPKIILKCPANTSGENKMEKAFWNVYYVLDNYLHDLFCKVDDDWDYNEYAVAFTENGAFDMPSDYLDLDNLDVFYVDVCNSLDVDGEYYIAPTGFYKSIEDTDGVLITSSKNSLIIDVDDFNAVCDDLYIQALYEKTVNKLFNTDSYEYSFPADAKIVKAVCKDVDKYISNLSNANSHHISHIKTDEIESLPDDYNVKVTFYIEEDTVDAITVLKYYAMFKKYSCADIINGLDDETKLKESFKLELSLDSFKQLVNGTLNEIDADVRLNIISLVSNVGDVYFIKSVEMVRDMLLYYANEKYTVDLNISEFSDVCKNVDVTGFVVATFNAAIKPKRIKVEYQYFSTQEKMGESLYNTNRDKHSYYRGIIPSAYKEFENEKEKQEKEGNNNMKNNKDNGAKKNIVTPAPTIATNVVLPEIERVYYNKTKKTVNIFWSNGTETKAITAEGDKFSLTAGIKECFTKYACGNNFDGVQKRIEDAKKKAVLTDSKEKKNKKSKVERLVEEVANANLTSDEKDDLVIALDKVINTETIKPVKQNKKGSR